MAHRNQKRKGTELPYIVHPFGVMTIASEATDNEDILIACLFHDILEDVPDEYSKDQMEQDFGKKVVSIVEGVTKDSSLASWQDRADAYLDHLEHEASDESVIVSCADKIHNLMSILEDYKEVGDDIWQRFSTGKKGQQWWYRAVYEVIAKRLPELTLNRQLFNLVDQLVALKD